MNNRLKFLLAVTPIIWLVVVAPLTILISWWTPVGTIKSLAWSVLAAVPVTAWLFLSFQTSSLFIKWPATQLIGWTTILLNVLAPCSLLLLIFSPSTVAMLATVFWVITGCHAVWAAHDIKNTSLTVTSPKLDRSYRMLQLSDVHAGSRSSAFIDKVVTQAISHRPELVLITGDLLDSSAVDSDYLQPLSRFTCPVFLCLGNHERYVNLQAAIDAINANKVKILRDEAVAFNALEIIGIDDNDTDTYVATTIPRIDRSADKFQILLYHRPQGFEAAAQSGIDLMLSGHTHAGQIWPFGVLVQRQFPLMKGQHQHGASTLYVSQGTGTWGPIMRLGTICEMTVITVKHPDHD